jgi:hypothetical protein
VAALDDPIPLDIRVRCEREVFVLERPEFNVLVVTVGREDCRMILAPVARAVVECPGIEFSGIVRQLSERMVGIG